MPADAGMLTFADGETSAPGLSAAAWMLLDLRTCLHDACCVFKGSVSHQLPDRPALPHLLCLLLPACLGSRLHCNLLGQKGDTQGALMMSAAEAAAGIMQTSRPSKKTQQLCAEPMPL